MVSEMYISIIFREKYDDQQVESFTSDDSLTLHERCNRGNRFPQWVRCCAPGIALCSIIT